MYIHNLYEYKEAIYRCLLIIDSHLTYYSEKRDEMNVWKRAGIYLTKNRGRCILLFFILTLISGVIMLSLCLRKGSQESVQKLRKTYGSNFFIKADKEGKLPEYNEKTVEKIIEKTRETGGIGTLVLKRPGCHCILVIWNFCRDYILLPYWRLMKNRKSSNMMIITQKL